MSQAKVEKYKEYKKNKKKILQKEKRKRTAAKVIIRTIGVLAVAGILTLIVLWGMGRYKAYLDARPNYTADSFVIGDICGVLETETDAPETEEPTEDEPTTGGEDETAAEAETSGS